MLSSGNGRHRRPRQAPAAVVTVATAAATGVGIALPLISAGSAQAADATTWDKVAACETGGVWGANTDNGFFGGLAITQDTWDQYGGDAYAKRPDLATRAQQITVAQKILTDLGPNAWPGCELTTGLLIDTATPDVDPTATPVPDPSGPTGIQPSSGATTAPSDSGTPTTSPTTPDDPGTPTTGTPTDPGTPTTGTPSTPPSGSGTPTTSPTAPTGSGTPTTGTPTDPGTPTTGSGRHGKPYDPTDDELAAQDRATRTEVFSTADPTPASDGANGGGSGSGSQGAHRTKPSTGQPAEGKSTTDGYEVGSGDSLSGIAAAHHVAGGWHQLYETNHALIGDDPNLIKPGQILNLG
ncbi:transglycosylase family protein [Streptomyces sp. NBC_00669]|uniref:transglycosylase family protein n=1 Tax=Streptomyces sp. NBC_00669 TaxID=2976011 RepID=UPI002E375796|nr:transglycosylase family protein [Streptomyces sp. NBC_00669]